MTGDRNFDDLAGRFRQRIYGGLKGRVRLAVIDRELQRALPEPCVKRPLEVVDIGCGLAQLSLGLAASGHRVIANDLSLELLKQAQTEAAKLGINGIDWRHGPYQSLQITADSIDLLLCHAVLEWLAEPEQLLNEVSTWLRPGGFLSLSFYNPAAKEYRNLIRGNFAWLQQQQDYRSDAGSLTPNQPCQIDDVRHWAASAGLDLVASAGIRVFSDYVVEKRGGLADEEQVLAMELAYANREPYKWLGRYIHLLLQKPI